MLRTQISLEPEQHEALKAIARQEKRSISSVIREMLDEQIREKQKQTLVQAARSLLKEYQEDTELTAFTVLDGEDFHAQG